jgi:hypothetical protein
MAFQLMVPEVQAAAMCPSCAGVERGFGAKMRRRTSAGGGGLRAVKTATGPGDGLAQGGLHAVGGPPTARAMALGRVPSKRGQRAAGWIGAGAAHLAAEVAGAGVPVRITPEAMVHLHGCGCCDGTAPQARASRAGLQGVPGGLDGSDASGTSE